MTPRLVDYYSRTSLISETVYDLVLREGVASLTPVRLAEELAWSLTSTRRALASGQPIPEYALALIDRRYRLRLNRPRPDTLVGGIRRPDEAAEAGALAAMVQGVTSDVTEGVLALDAAIPMARECALRRRSDLGLPTEDDAALRDSA